MRIMHSSLPPVVATVPKSFWRWFARCLCAAFASIATLDPALAQQASPSLTRIDVAAFADSFVARYLEEYPDPSLAVVVVDGDSIVFPEGVRHWNDMEAKLWVITLVLAAAAPVAFGGMQRPDPVLEMRAYVERFTGSEPVDCGRHELRRGDRGNWVEASAEALQVSVDCGVATAGERRPFWTFKQRLGMDSWLGEGLLGTAKGEIYRFSFDGDPCGGAGCPGKITFERCVNPAVNAVPRPAFRCLR